MSRPLDSAILWSCFTRYLRPKRAQISAEPSLDIARAIADSFAALTPDVRQYRGRRTGVFLYQQRAAAGTRRRRQRRRSHAVAPGASRAPEPRGSHNSGGPWPHPGPGADDPSARCHGNWLIMRRPSEIGANQLTGAGVRRFAGAQEARRGTGDDYGVKQRAGLPASARHCAAIVIC